MNSLGPTLAFRARGLDREQHFSCAGDERKEIVRCVRGIVDIDHAIRGRGFEGAREWLQHRHHKLQELPCDVWKTYRLANDHA